MRNFKELKVWQKAHELTLVIYRATEQFPKSELYGLTSQIRRSAASIPTNIAEGCGRHTDKRFVRFCDIANGSASEAHYQLILSYELGYLSQSEFQLHEAKVVEVKRMLHGLTRSIRARLK